MPLTEIKKSLIKNADDEKAKILSRFFKTGPGQYGSGDKFLGIKVPVVRKIVKENSSTPFSEIGVLLNSEFHEERLTALLLLVHKYSKGDEAERKSIFKYYIKNTKRINNWDLVDLSAPNIVGDYLLDRDKSLLYELASSDDLWKKRISVISTLRFIRENRFDTTTDICRVLLNDRHDLIHKACGWMLREIGKRNLSVEENFLKAHYKQMPRTMLRYAIEKFPENKRKAYLLGKI